MNGNLESKSILYSGTNNLGLPRVNTTWIMNASCGIGIRSRLTKKHHHRVIPEKLGENYWRLWLGWPEFLDSALLCMLDSVYKTSQNYGISFAKEKTSEDKGRFKRKNKIRLKMEWFLLVGFEPSMDGLQFVFYLVSKAVQVHAFMPDLKVGRLMPVVVDNTTLLLCRRRMKLLVTTEANLRTNLSSLTISFKSPLFTLLCFYKIQLPFPRSASKIQSHIQSTVNYIFEQLPYFSGISSLGLVAPEVFGIPANTLLWEESK